MRFLSMIWWFDVGADETVGDGVGMDVSESQSVVSVASKSR